LRILSRLTAAGPDLQTKQICDVCAEITGMTGAGIMLMSDDVPQGSVCASDELAALLQQLQYTLGEGPSVDAYQEDHTISEPHLARDSLQRWLAFSPPAIEAGVRSVFAFPIHVGAVRLGCLNLYSRRTGPFSDDQYADALALADIAAQTVLLLQANAPAGRLATELEAGGEFQYVVHQAAGMVAAQLDVTIGHALIRLRAHAFGCDRPLTQVAEQVVARVLRFDA
jgi:hypothetical protein